MKCGDRGHTTVQGRPCDQNIPDDAAGCLWHTRDAAERRELALRGSIKGAVRKKRALPGTTPYPVLADPEGCRRVLSDTIQQVRTGHLHPQLGSVVIAGVRAAVELASLEVSAQVTRLERLLDERRRA